MKILHTSDIHLNNPNDARFKALECILDNCSIGKYNVDLLTISGDLFHGKDNIYDLKRGFRELIENYTNRNNFFKPNFKILIIPGNHDENLYDINDFLGTNVEILCGKTVCTYDLGNLRILGIPYFKGDLNSIIPEIEEYRDASITNILMIHGTLDFPEIKKEECGEEGEYKYLPLTSEQLIYLDFDYVLAGHFHSCFIKSYQKSQDSKKNWFIYPGSPVKVTKNEKGKRKAYLVDTEEEEIKQIELDSLYFDACSVKFHPFNMEQGFSTISQFVNQYKEDWELKKAELEIVLEGYISIPEKEFIEKLEKIVNGITYKNNVLQVIELLNNPLFKRFKEILEQKDIDDITKDKLLNFVIEVF